MWRTQSLKMSKCQFLHETVPILFYHFIFAVIHLGNCGIHTVDDSLKRGFDVLPIKWILRTLFVNINTRDAGQHVLMSSERYFLFRICSSSSVLCLWIPTLEMQRRTSCRKSSREMLKGRRCNQTRSKSLVSRCLSVRLSLISRSVKRTKMQPDEKQE